jgi:Flp pilus assembly pilin Flp
MKARSRVGQSTLEYTLILAAVIAVVVMVLFGSGGLQCKMGSAYNATGTALTNTTNSLNAGVFQP